MCTRCVATYATEGHLDKALATYGAICEAARAAHNGLLEGYTLVQLAEVHTSLNDSARAIACFEQAARLLKETDMNAEATVYFHLAQLYWKAQDKVKAIQTFAQCVPVALASGNAQMAAYARMNIGRVYLSSADYRTAVQHLEKEAIPLFDAAGDTHGRAVCLLQVIRAYRSVGDLARAQQSAREALASAERAGSAAIVKACQKFLSLHPTTTAAAPAAGAPTVATTAATPAAPTTS